MNTKEMDDLIQDLIDWKNCDAWLAIAKAEGRIQ